MLAAIKMQRNAMRCQVWLLTLIIAIVPALAKAQSIHVDNNLLNALNPANDVPPPGAIVPNPDPKPTPAATPSTPAAPASGNLPTPEQIMIDPRLSVQTNVLPVPSGNNIVHYPITQHISTETIDPSAAPTAPAPTPDLEQSMAPAMQKAIAKSPTVVVKKTMPIAATKTTPVKVAHAPPIPKHRPAIARASQAFVDKARAQAHEQQALTPPPARPQINTAPIGVAQNVDAAPLQDMLNKPMSPVGKAQMVATIKDIAAKKEAGNPATLQVPRPPPPDAREKQFLTILYNSGTLQPNATNLAVLQTQVLPLLKTNPRWRVQIQSFATPQGKELISARRISLSRALALRDWFMNHGIAPERMDLRALGLQSDREPLDRIDLVFFDPDVDNKRP